MLWILFQVFIWTTVSLALLFGGAFASGRWFSVERYPDEVHYVKTSDGWRIAVTRYRPETPSTGDPVLLCHGIGSNQLSMDLTEELSLARALSKAGHDTWLVELRGRGLSTRPKLFGKYRYDWSFDEYVERDVPVAIAAVLEATGRKQLHWVGFSLGALVGYAVLSDPREMAKIRSAVAIAGPSTFNFQGKYLFSWPVRNLRWLRHQLLMRVLAPIAGYWRPKLLHNPENIDGATIRRFMVGATANFARNEMLQYSDWIGQNQFRSIDHRRDYRKDMAKIEIPMMFIAGNKDRLAPPPSVKDAFESIGSVDKRMVMASRTQGLEANYGHLDLVLGRSAPKDIYPLVVRWIEEQEGREKGPAPARSEDMAGASAEIQ